jgi:hypothetical protein
MVDSDPGRVARAAGRHPGNVIEELAERSAASDDVQPLGLQHVEPALLAADAEQWLFVAIDDQQCRSLAVLRMLRQPPIQPERIAG